MNKEITINVQVKKQKDISVPLKLTLKTFSKADELIYIWKTPEIEEFFLAVIHNNTHHFYPHNIKKDTRILTTKEEIAEQIIEKSSISINYKPNNYVS